MRRHIFVQVATLLLGLPCAADGAAAHVVTVARPFALGFGLANEAAEDLQPAPPIGTGQSETRTGASASFRYKVSGNRALRPIRMHDDGMRTYIEWDQDQALPAVFVLNEMGQEETTDGYMREGIYTIDRVNRRLIFRIGKDSAKAERITVRNKR